MTFIMQLRLLLLIGGIVPLAAALISQYVFGMHPCEMCLYQRVPYALVAALSLYAWLKPEQQKLIRILLICIILWVIEGGLAAYHVGIEEGWWESATGCTAADSKGQSLDALRQAIMNSPVVSCSDVAFRFIGLSMAAWNVIASVGLVVAGMALRKRKSS
ncbi:MAG: disulfide bond formation protein B [Rickettsiales bacterium]|nr:disulfide bond formation protein B [Rickettsiales bacterium]